MTLSINTNIGSVIAGNQLNKLNNEYGSLQEQATTGKKINRAADDAAGMAILMGMKKTFMGNESAMNNITRGKDLLAVQEEAMTTINTMMERLKELAVTSADGTMSAADRTKNNTEAQSLMGEMDRIAKATTYNGIQLLDGSVTSVTLQVGSGNTVNDQIAVTNYDATLASMNINGGDISTVVGAQTFLDNLDIDNTTLTSGLSSIGSTTNRLDYANENLVNMNKSLESSMSSIEDADMAKVSAQLAKNETLQQLGYSMLAKSNQQPRSYLSLFG